MILKITDEDLFKISSRYGSFSGEFHPEPPCPPVNVISAPYGGFSSTNFFNVTTAWSGSRVGGSLKETLTDVSDRKTFPATAVGGKPSIPTIERAGLQILQIKRMLTWRI